MFLKTISTNLDDISESYMFLIGAGNVENVDIGTYTLVFYLVK